MPKIWWKRGKNPAQPIGSGKQARVVYDLLRSADGPMNKGLGVGVFYGSTAANLLALMPDLQRFQGVCRAVDEFGGEHAVDLGRRGHSDWYVAKFNLAMKKATP